MKIQLIHTVHVNTNSTIDYKIYDAVQIEYTLRQATDTSSSTKPSKCRFRDRYLGNSVVVWFQTWEDGMTVLSKALIPSLSKSLKKQKVFKVKYQINHLKYETLGFCPKCC